MSYKKFVLNDQQITIYKRKSAKHIKLTISDGTNVKVSMPNWVPYKAGLEFVKSKESWIKSKVAPEQPLSENQAIGKAHHLSFNPSPNKQKVTSRIMSSEIVISYPEYLNLDNLEVQKVAQKASIKALRQQAESLLPQRLSTLAITHGFSYESVKVKQLKSRWGSCDQQKNIVLNLYLMQMPWDLIDYVLLHELTHTKVLKHGPVFWSTLEEYLPNLKNIKKRMRQYRPILSSPLSEFMT